MRASNLFRQRRPPVLLALCAAVIPQWLGAAAPGTVDLLATPPEITASVAPNVVLSFDDSGSMAWEYMPDDRPYEPSPKDWRQSDPFPLDESDKWFCAGRIDPRVTDPDNPRSKPLNGMYYDPNVTYRPPLKADGVTPFPNASFTAAWNDGIKHNRPDAPVAQGTRNLGTSVYCRRTHYQLAAGSFSQNWSNTGLISSNNNWNSVPFMRGYRGDGNVTATGVNPSTVLGVGNRTINVRNAVTTPSTWSSTDQDYGVFEVTGGTEIGSDPTIALQPSSRTDNTRAYAPNIVLRLDTATCSNIVVGYKLRDIDTGTTATQPFSLQVRNSESTTATFTSIDYVANANTGGTLTRSITLPTDYNDKDRVELRWITTNSTDGNDAMIGIDDITVTGTCGTPVADPPAGAGYYQLKSTVALTADSFGRITNATTALYNPRNWEWVALPAAQQGNFANWYSYYRNRNRSAITAMSRAFAPFNEKIRVAWQNLGNNDATSAPIFTATTPIYKFLDEAVNSNVRTRFYNWLFQIPASGGTPNIATSIRAGEFFKRAGGAVDTNPYWDRDLNRELSCRQNFHINMSDGFWNSGNPAPPPAQRYLDTGTALPDGRNYNIGIPETRFFNRYTGTQAEPNLADVMFHYWASDLRPDFAANDATRLKVPPFIPDRSTTLFGNPVGTGQNALDNLEVYWNPANDPATWPHLVNFNISFGLDGTLPQTDDVYRALRLGNNPSFIWPHPAVGTDDPRKLDDFWHAATVSRGRFLSAKNPEELITALQEVIASIIARRGAATAVSVSLPIITDGTTGYTGGYDTTDWAGFVHRNDLDQETAEVIGIEWDAGCILTGGACASTNTTYPPARDPASRLIITSDGGASAGKLFLWSELSALQRARLNVDPATIRLDLGTWTNDTFGDERLDYIRGDRTYESTVSPRFRQRSSVLGAVIRGQPVYVSAPTSGYPDTFPAGSPEQVAYQSGNSYARFQNSNRGRAPTLYVSSNDGMLHAFDAASGEERFAYVPNAIIENFRLTLSTKFEGGFTPTVDEKPLVTDVFIGNQWRTVLLGALRLGGRGVFLVDITRPDSVTESTLPRWEFTNVAPPGDTSTDCAPGARFCSSLGYTYGGANIARIKYQDKWVALISSGYFPIDSLDPASTSPKANQTSLLVVDLATGSLIREIKTNSAPQTATQSFGLSQAVVMDNGADYIDDVAIAGDLAGNLWRFDLTAESPSDWKVDLMFKSYGSGGAAAVGDQPIAFAPAIMATTDRRNPMIVFGTGKFIGQPDRSAAIPQQSFYGLQDYGTCGGADGNPTACANYPITPDQLNFRKIIQASNAIRTVTTPSLPPQPTNTKGWRIPMDIPSEAGERANDTPFGFFDANLVLLRSIIPKGVDPCDPGARYGLMVVSAATGEAPVDPSESSPSQIVGGVLASETPPGDPVVSRGGGNVMIPGLRDNAVVNAAVIAAITGALERADNVWHRGAWREILNQ